MLNLRPSGLPAPARPLAYTRTQIVLHWLVAVLVLLQYSTSGAMMRAHGIHLIGWRPSPIDLALQTAHSTVGLLIVAVMALRLAVRLRRSVPPLPSDPDAWTTWLPRAAHWAFYAILIAQGVTGAIAIYFWWPISAIHVLLFKALLALLSVHVAAALWHQFVQHDNTLMRMFRSIPGA